MKGKFVLIFFFYSIIQSISCKKGDLNINGPAEKEGWELTFDDEFTDPVLNSTYWLTNYIYGKSKINEHQCYEKKNVTIVDGKLYLTAYPEKSQCWCGNQPACPTDYASGMICGSQYFEQLYGYFEARIKIQEGQGLCPAFWLNSNEGWPPEIDILEMKGQKPGKLHMGCFAMENGIQVEARTHRYKRDLSKDFHVYAVEWTNEYVKFFFDNKLQFTTHKGVAHLPMHVLITNQVGIGFVGLPDKSTDFPNSLIVDYVRVYKKK